MATMPSAGPSSSAASPAVRRWGIALALGLGLGLVAALPALDWVHRIGIDLMLPVRHAVSGPLWAPEQSDVVVVALDEETYRTPPFAGRPQVAWTPYLATLLDAVNAAEPVAIGVDLIYPTTLDQPDLLPGFDKPFFRALIAARKANRVVLGKVRLSHQEIVPHPNQVRMAGGVANVRMLNVIVDDDQVVRQYPANFADEAGGSAPSLGMELAQRAGAKVPAGDFLINYNTGAADLPVYSWADLYACAQAGKSEFFARHFAGKIVLIGQDLDLEDRLLGAKRFTLDRGQTAKTARCELPEEKATRGSVVERRTMPGVFIHAAAINTVTKKVPLTAAPRWANGLSVGLLAAFLALLFYRLRPASGAAAGGAVVGATLAGSLALFTMAGIVAPVIALSAAAAIAFTAVYAYRFLVEDKAKRWILHAFNHFLAPELVKRLADDPTVLQLGGTTREVTVFFSDIAGFTTLSEAMAAEPEKLVEILNRYLTVVTARVEANGGYVDKFIGDAVMAVWGAPLEDAEAARHAVDSALDSLAALEDFNRDVIQGVYGMPPIGTRIGINSGRALVGNMGSETRLNYTVAGDVVNLAARLEGANKAYGSRIMIGEATAAALGDGYVLRLLDLLVVKGKHKPVRVFEVMGRVGQVPAEVVSRLEAYAHALDHYFARRFEEAEAAFAALASFDPPAAIYRDRCSDFRQHPPADDWDGRYELKSK